MTLLFRAEDLEWVDDALALRAMEASFDAEAAGKVTVPKRVDTRTGKGFLRVMPAILGDVMGLKVMTLVEGLGTRYVILLYDVASGALLAIFDADELTRLRTAAVTTLAARALVGRPPRRLGMIGTGFEAEAQLRAVASLWPECAVAAYSPTQANRERFAQHATRTLGRPVEAAGSAAEAVADTEVVLLATKSKPPVLDGKALARGAVVLSIGATRPDLRELDTTTLERAGTMVGDDPAQLASESGDIAEAFKAGALTPERVVALAAVRCDPTLVRTDQTRDLVVFKSVGTALQDLAIASAVREAAAGRGRGTDLGEVTRLKAFAPAPRP
ncbi:ornithine cyclodeaminase family protein [soil metagenome]